LRRRSVRPSIAAGSFERSIADRTVSVTPLAGVVTGVVASARISLAGHWLLLDHISYTSGIGL
jgi:hypothetical protein